MRDVLNGWLIRYIHANGASMFFIVVYAHIGRGLYYGSYMEPRELLWCSGVILLLLMMGTAFTGARVRRVGRFSTQETSAGITRLIQSLKASCGDVWSCFNFKNISSLVLHEPRVARAKRFNRVLKAFINYLKALKGVVSRLFRAFFLRISSLIPKRFWIYSKAHNYIKPVLTKNRTTLTNTLNYNVRGEIRKIMLPNRGTRSDNRLAPRHRYFSTVIPQTGALVPVKNKSEHFNQTSSLLFNKTSQVSLDTILFIEKMNKIEEIRSTLYRAAFSTDSLLSAYDQIKSRSGNLTPGQGKETLTGISLHWFRTTSKKLLNNSFVYPKMRRVSFPKKPGLVDTRFLTLTSPRIKIIERSILNVLEPQFEGKFVWEEIEKSEYEFIKTNNATTTVVANKSGYFKKNWTKFPVFSRFSFGFRPKRSAHGALQLIKSWPVNLSWFIKFDIVKAFDAVNHNRLKNIFLKYCPDNCIWNEISKLLKVGIVNLKISSPNDLGISQGSVLSPFLFNVYMTEFDNFVELLQLKYNKENEKFSKDSSIKNKYEQFARKFRTKRGLATTLAQTGSPELVLALYKKEHSAFLKQYGSTKGENKNLRRITYVRYADDFIVGITGSRDFALKVSTEMESFLKSNLHFNVSQVNLKSRDKGAIQFLGFNIYLSSIKNKAKTKSNKIKSIVKYKKRSIARLKGSDARISQAYFNSIKHGFLNYLQNMYEKLDLKKTKNTDLLLVEHFVNTNIKELLAGKTTQQLNLQNPNLALRRFTQHFKDLFSKNIDVSLQVWHKNFENLEPYTTNFTLTKELTRVIEARNKFLDELKKIEDSVIDKTREAAKNEAIELYRQKQSLKFFNRSSFSKISARDFSRAAELLSLRTLDITRARRISIRFNIKNFYEKLAELGFYSKKRNSPLSVPKLIFLNDYKIISFYNSLIRGYLNWFRCADNFTSAKKVIWTLRMSCLKTLARKHKKNLKWALTVFTIDVVAISSIGQRFSLPSMHEISQMNTKFLLKTHHQQPDAKSLLNKYSLRQHSSHFLFSKCAVDGCFNSDIEIHHVKKLGRRVDSNGKISVLTANNRRLSGISAILSAVNQKQLPLCSLHHLEFETGKYSPLDLNHLKKIYNVDCSGLNFEKIYFGK